jgi:hypothetical protein
MMNTKIFIVHFASALNSVGYWSEFLAANPEALGSISGAFQFSA